MDDRNLPEGFVWHGYVAGDGLFLGIIAVALVRARDEGGWELETNPSWPESRRIETYDDQRNARLAANAWACKWEFKLREQCAWINGVAPPLKVGSKRLRGARKR